MDISHGENVKFLIWGLLFLMDFAKKLKNLTWNQSKSFVSRFFHFRMPVLRRVSLPSNFQSLYGKNAFWNNFFDQHM